MSHLQKVPYGLWNDGSSVPRCSCVECENHLKRAPLNSPDKCNITDCVYHKPRPKGWPQSTCQYSCFGKMVKGHEDKFAGKKYSWSEEEV